ncbi:hypothetical protein FKM82_002319 [Ascaphus truei]
MEVSISGSICFLNNIFPLLTKWRKCYQISSDIFLDFSSAYCNSHYTQFHVNATVGISFKHRKVNTIIDIKQSLFNYCCK